MDRLVKILSILKPQIKSLTYSKNDFGESLIIQIWDSSLESHDLKEIALLVFVKSYTLWVIDGNYSIDIMFHKSGE